MIILCLGLETVIADYHVISERNQIASAFIPKAIGICPKSYYLKITTHFFFLIFSVYMNTLLIKPYENELRVANHDSCVFAKARNSNQFQKVAS